MDHVSLDSSRGQALRMISAGFMGAGLAGCARLVPQNVGLALLPNPLTDPAVFNFALNLEYLAAEYYNRGLHGHGLPTELVGPNPGPVLGGRISVLKGSARKLKSLSLRESAAGLLGAEGYHMGAVRSVIYRMGDAARARAAAISNLRDQLDGPQDLDQPPVKVGDVANIAPTNENGIVWGRTPQHALNIAYGKPGPGIMAGGFFPEGVNGRIRVT